MNEIEIFLEDGPLDGQTRNVPAETQAIAEAGDKFTVSDEWEGPAVYTRSGITRYGRPVFRYSKRLDEPDIT